MQYHFKQYLFFFTVLFITNSNAQLKEENKWKALINVGFNHPFADGFIETVTAKPINFPTVNLGVQRMFKHYYGVRLDYGFNRFKNDEGSLEFKINYSRINVQFVYNPTRYLNFLPLQMQTVLHIGPGIAFVKPLGGLRNNKQTYPNINAGLEFHYAINKKVSIYTDVSYLYGITSLDNYNPTIKGLGAFNGNVLNLTLGLTVSLSGCQYCE